jgi:hypothetical protein
MKQVFSVLKFIYFFKQALYIKENVFRPPIDDCTGYNLRYYKYYNTVYLEKLQVTKKSVTSKIV